jgi:hypothetical protein
LQETYYSTFARRLKAAEKAFSSEAAAGWRKKKARICAFQAA